MISIRYTFTHSFIIITTTNEFHLAHLSRTNKKKKQNRLMIYVYTINLSTVVSFLLLPYFI